MGPHAIVPAGSRILPGAFVECLSAVPAHAVVSGMWSGVPARPIAETEHRVPTPGQCARFAAQGAVMAVLSLSWWLIKDALHATVLIQVLINAIDTPSVFLGLIALVAAVEIVGYYIFVIAFCRLTPATRVPMDLPLHSPSAWLAATKLQLATDCALRLGDASIQPTFIRACGAKVGSGCHLSEMVVLPDALEIGSECFFASGNILTSLCVDQGRLKVPTKTIIGNGAFMGNVNHVHAGLRDNTFVGRFTWLPELHLGTEARAFFGNPAMRFARPQSSNAGSEVMDGSSKLDEMWQQVSTSFIDVLIWPVLHELQFPVWFMLASYFVPGIESISDFGIQVAIYVMLEIFCWWALHIKVGNYLVHDGLPLSNGVHSRVVTSWFRETRIRKAFTLPFTVEGTAWHSYFLRLLGVQVGKGFFSPNAQPLVDACFARLGDDITIDYDAYVHQHSFEDELLKWGPKHVGTGTTLMQGACLAACDAGQDVILRPGSITWKGQELEFQSLYEGSPAKLVNTLPYV